MTSSLDDARLQRLRRTERAMIRIRWVGVVFGLVQVLTFYLPYPPGILPVALAIVGGLAIGNLLVWVAARRVRTERQAVRLGAAALVLDIAVVMAFVFVYTFDFETAMFAIVYILPLEGAIRLQLRGALAVMAVATVVYAVREAYGAAVFGHEFLLTSITFRMGIGFIIASVAGAMASALVQERDDLERMTVELERVAARLRDANEELRAANELKDDFIAVTNHELRTPLTTILGYTSVLRSRWEKLPDEQRRSFVGLVDQQGRRLLHLVEDLLAFSVAQAGRLELYPASVDLQTIVRDAIASNGEKAQGVEDRCPPDLRVRADPSRLGQILTNYISNALKYGEPPITVDARRDGGQVEIRVTDAGAGVPPQFVPELFEKFTQATGEGARDSRGSGLGLAIVRQLAEAHGGEAWYEPAEPSGATFCVSLPAADRQEG